MDCDFEEKTAYVYSLNDRRKIERELDALEKLGVPGEFTDRLPLPFPVAGAVRYPNQAQFHPLKWIAAISKSLHICAGAGAGRNNCNYGLWKSHGKQNNCSHPLSLFE